jgi:hypothetical protein
MYALWAPDKLSISENSKSALDALGYPSWKNYKKKPVNEDISNELKQITEFYSELSALFSQMELVA